MKNIKPYRIKHVSGLYYQPAKGRKKSNLSTLGNVYFTKNSPFYDRSSYIYIQVDKETRVFSKVKDFFPLNSKGNISCSAHKAQFIIEEL